MAVTPSPVKSILKKENLEEVKIITSHFHNYGSICLTKKRERVYLKVRLYPKLVPKKKFVKEVLLTKFLWENFYSNRHFLTPKYYSGNLKKSPEWVVREYSQGKRTGDVWGFEPDFYQKFSPQKIADILDFIRKNVPEKFREKFKKKEAELFEKDNVFSYKNYFLKFLPFAKKYLKPSERKKVMEIFKKYKKILAENNYLVHGDLHPGNVIASENKIMLHDWKYAHFNNPYFDFTFVWFLSWLNENWRKELFNLELKRVKDKDLFKKLFYLSVLKLTPKMISIMVQAGAISKKNREKGIKKVLNVFKEALKKL